MIASSQITLIGGLLERERLTRFAGGGLGNLWAYLTPIAWIFFVVVLFRVLNREPPIYVPAEIFVATGILPYLAFRQTISSLVRTVPANRSLLYIRPIKAHDLLLASALREILNLITTSLLTFTAITLIFGARLPTDPANVILGLGLAWILACGVGRFIAAIGLMSDSFARAVPILLRPVFWLSGIFYTATELPESLQALFWYSPLLHITEITRQGYFLGYHSPIANVWCPIFIAASFYLLAGPIERAVLLHRKGRYRL